MLQATVLSMTGLLLVVQGQSTQSYRSNENCNKYDLLPLIGRFEEMERVFRDLRERVGEMKEACQAKDNKVRDMEDRLQRMQNNLYHLQSKAENAHVKVAFSALMATEYLRPTNNSYVTVPFEKVTLNIGNHYSGVTSKFTCPVSGVYHFNYNIRSGVLETFGSEKRCTVEGELVKNGDTINSVYCINEDFVHRKYCDVTKFATIPCEAQSKVWIKAKGTQTQIAKGSGFSGFLLFPNP